jgi:fibronectin-binding autotransporter adhesin
MSFTRQLDFVSRMNGSRRRSIKNWVAAVFGIFALLALPDAAKAQGTYYWNTTTTGTWSTGTNWSNSATSGGTTGYVPGTSSSDLAVFNQSSVNGAETVQLSSAVAIGGITFANTNTTLLESSTGTQTLAIGGSGITINSGAGAVTLGNSSLIVNVQLSASQTWTNNSTATMIVTSAITNVGNTTPFTLTVSNTTSGGITFNGIISDGGTTGVTSLLVNSTGAGAVKLNAANTYSGATTIQAGTLTVASPGSIANSSGLNFTGTGTFNYAAASAGSNITLNALSFSAGDGTVNLTAGASNTSTLAITTLNARASGASTNFTTSGTGASITAVNTATGFIDQGTFFNGSNYAWVGTGGVLRAISYGSDSGAVTSGATTSLASATYQQFTGAITAQTAASFTTLSNNGADNFTIMSGNTVTTNGILTNGATVISGGTAITTTTSGADLVLRANSGTLTISTPLQANGVNALVKTGTGSLYIQANSTITGQVFINQGTLRIDDTSSSNSSNDTIAYLATTTGVTVQNGATLAFYRENYAGGGNTNTWTMPTVTLNGGATVTFGDQTGTISNALSNTFVVNGPASFNLSAGGYGETMNLSGANGVLQGTGNISLNSTGGSAGGTRGYFFATASPAFSGNWTVTGSNSTNLDILQSQAAGALGSGTVTLTGYSLLNTTAITSSTFLNSITGITVNSANATFTAPIGMSSTNTSTPVALIAGIINIGASGTPGTVTTGSLTMSGGTLNLYPSATATDKLALNGGLTLSGGTISVSFSAVPTTSQSDTLLSYATLTGTPSGTVTVGGNTYSLASVGVSSLRNGTLTVTGNSTTAGSVVLAFTGAPGGSIVWTGANNNNNFDVVTTQNFTLSGTPTTFYNGDNVTFNDTPTSGNFTPTIPSGTTIIAGSLTFANVANSYLLTGTGTLGASGGVTTISVAGGGAGTTTVTALLAGGITKTGAGTLILGGNQAYTGATIISAGTLQLSSATALGASAATVSVTSGAVLDLNGQTMTNTNPLTLNGTGISSGGSLTNSSATAGTYAGLITLGSTGVSIVASSGNIILSATGTITGSGDALTLGGTAAGSKIASIIGTGTGTVTKTGAGTWSLSGASTYTGATTVNNGILLLNMSTNATGVLSASSALVLGGGTLSITGKSTGTSAQTVASLALTADTASSIVLTPNGGTSTTLTITSATVTAGAGAAVNFNLSAGTTNASTSTVGNTIVAWNPNLTNGIIGAGYSVTDSGGSGFATVSSGQVVRLADNGSSGLPVSGGGATNNFFVNQNYSTSSTSTAGSLVLALSSGGVAANTVTVDTTGLTSGANLALGGNMLTLTSGGGIFFNGANPYTISATAGGGITTSASGGAITFNNLNSVGVMISAPILANGANSVTINGGGTLTLSGVNTFTGGVIINAGALLLGSAGALNSTAGSQDAVTFGANAANSATLILNGNSVVIANLTTNASPGAPIVQNANATPATLTIGNSTNASGAFAGVIQDGTGGGALSLIKAGTGALTLSGPNAYSGGTTISAGTVKVGSATALGASSGAVSVTSGAALDLNGQTMTNANALTLNGTGISSGGSLTNSSATAGTYAGSITLGSTGVSIVASSGNIILSATGTITGSGDALTLGGTATGSSIAAGIGTGTGTLTKSGAGTWALSGANTYTGTTTISAGTLSFTGTGNVIGAVAMSGSSTLFVAAAGVVSTGAINTTGATDTINVAGALTSSSVSLAYATNITVAGTFTTGALSITPAATTAISGVGTINAASFTLGNAGSILNFGASGAALSDTGSFIAANGYTNTFNQTAGTVTLSTSSANALTLASGSNAKGTYNLSGGTLNALNAALDLTTGTSSTITGTLSISGGTANVLGLNYAQSTATTGTLTLTAGAINIGAGGLVNSGTTENTNLGAGTVGAFGGNWSSSLAMSLTSASTGVTFNTLDSVDGVTPRTITLSGALSGVGALVKTGAGTLVLSAAASNYSGGTVINGGTLVASNSTGSATGTGNVTVNSTGMLAGTGFITPGASNSVTVAAGGTIRGDVTGGFGTLTIGNNTSITGAPGTTGGIILTEVTDSGSTGTTLSGNSLIKLTAGALNLGVTANANLININVLNTAGDMVAGATYTINVAQAPSFTLNGGSALSNGVFDSGTFNTLTPSGSNTTASGPAGSYANVSFTSGSSGSFANSVTNWSLGVSGNNLVLTLSTTATPEPSRIMLICASVLGLGFGVRRRRRKTAIHREQHTI